MSSVISRRRTVGGAASTMVATWRTALRDSGIPLANGFENNAGDSMATAKTGRGLTQDRARVAGGQQHEVRYESEKSGASTSEVRKAVKKAGNSRSKVEAALAKGK
jgi:hypothetical protein